MVKKHTLKKSDSLKWLVDLALNEGSVVVAAVVAIVLTFSLQAILGNTTPPHYSDAIEKYKSFYKRETRLSFPSYNPYSDAKYELGKMLFFDPRLSRTGTVSCGSCHNPALSWTDGLPFVKGRFSQTAASRKTMSLLNVPWDRTLLWDAMGRTFEQQAFLAFMAEQGIGLTPFMLKANIKKIKGYRPYFEKAFVMGPLEEIQPWQIYQAVATFERKSAVSGIAPFDRWIEGDEGAISEKAKEGFLLFNTKAHCANCHKGWRFSDDHYYNIGLKDNDLGAGGFRPNEGKPELQFAFKAVGLRNIAIRPPYMHTGAFQTLEEVIDFYNRGGDQRRPNTRTKPLNLSAWEKEALIEFLKTLTGKDAPITIPRLPPINN